MQFQNISLAHFYHHRQSKVRIHIEIDYECIMSTQTAFNLLDHLLAILACMSFPI